jgi:hypothetical protein
LSYIEKIFRKNIYDFNISDLRTFFESEQEETSILEFKSGEVEINDLYKEISAFLNTEGGLIIIGSPRERKEKTGKNEKVICQGDLTYSRFRNKDWLYQKIATSIVPTPIGLKIFEHLDDKGAIYVIDIPQSTIPPHQCSSDGKYYIRLEREAKPAPHGLVQALFNKRRFPNLIGEINVNKINQFEDEVDIKIMNRSSFPADKVSFIIDVYNVNNVESKFTFISNQNDELGPKFSLSEKTDQILVQVISIPINFVVEHIGSEYLIFVGYWSKDSDFDFNYETYNPQTKTVTGRGTLKDSETLLTDELKRISK